MYTPELITDATRLKTIVELALEYPIVALDLESNGFHRYPERVCLVQMAFADRIFLVDPLPIDDIEPLGILLSTHGVEKIFHSADYDIRSLDRDWSFAVSPLYDTSIAAAFVGYRNLGLNTLLKECLEVEIDKTKRLQRADWTIRPITAELQNYAAEDVRHLERLSTLLRDRLDTLGRTEWVSEECQRLSMVRFSPSDKENAFLTVKGSRDLDGQGLAVLSALYRFREGQAVERDRPPFKIFSNAAMIALASNPNADLRSVKGLGQYAFGKSARQIRNALEEGSNAAPIDRRALQSTDRVRISSRERQSARKRLASLKRWRADHATRLDIQVGLVWNGKSLERIALDPSGVDEELLDDSVRNWQREALADSLFALVSSL